MGVDETFSLGESLECLPAFARSFWGGRSQGLTKGQEEKVRVMLFVLRRKNSGKVIKEGKAAGSETGPPALRPKHMKTGQGEKGGDEFPSRSASSMIKHN